MVRKGLIVLTVIVVVVVGAMAYSFLKTPEKASGSIEAIPITTDHQGAKR